MINTGTGVMEEQSDLSETMKHIVEAIKLDAGYILSAELIEVSKNHGGKPMIVIGCGRKDDVNIYNIEISEEGIFCYTVDDGIS